jgi:hypothetical protein
MSHAEVKDAVVAPPPAEVAELRAFIEAQTPAPSGIGSSTRILR